MKSFRNRLIQSVPVWSDVMKRSKPFVQNVMITGDAAGQLAVTAINKGDELVSVMNLTDLTDITSEFKANDDDDGLIVATGFIDNTGGGTTTTDKLLVSWLAWAE